MKTGFKSSGGGSRGSRGHVLEAVAFGKGRGSLGGER